MYGISHRVSGTSRTSRANGIINITPPHEIDHRLPACQTSLAFASLHSRASQLLLILDNRHHVPLLAVHAVDAAGVTATVLHPSVHEELVNTGCSRAFSRQVQ
jgi:hypothetical protein